MYKRLTSNFQELQSLPLRNSGRVLRNIKNKVIHVFNIYNIQPTGIRLWSFAGLFLYVRIVFAAASSVIKDGVFVKYLWDFSPEFLLIRSLKWTAIKERVRGRMTGETILLKD